MNFSLISTAGCEECCKYIQGECAIHHSSQPKLTYAVGSFPPEVRLCTSSIPEYTYGACAAKPMPRGTWIGPYEGRRVNLNQMPKDKDNTFGWEVRRTNTELVYVQTCMTPPPFFSKGQFQAIARNEDIGSFTSWKNSQCFSTLLLRKMFLRIKNHGSILIVRQDLLKNTYISDIGYLE